MIRLTAVSRVVGRMTAGPDMTVMVKNATIKVKATLAKVVSE